MERSPGWSIALLVAVAAAGTWLRLWNLGRHSLWLDEAWLANTLLSESLRDVVFKGPGVEAPNSTPFLLSLATHFLTRAFGDSEFVLRLLPALFSSGSIVAIWLLARRLGASTFTALLAAILIAFNPVSIDYAKELKQYAGDTFWIPLVLVGICRFAAKPTWAFALMLGIGTLVALGFAQTVALAMPGACLYLALRVLRERRSDVRPTWRQSMVLPSTAVVSIWCTGTALIYLFVIRHQSSERLVAFWDEFFPRSAQFSDVWQHARLHAVGFFKWFFEIMPNVHTAAGTEIIPWPKIAMVLAALGCIRLAIKRPAQLTLLVLMPGLVALALSTKRLFPFGAVRVDLFMLPFILLLVAFSADAIAALVRPLAKPLRWEPTASTNEHVRRVAAFQSPALLIAIAVTLALPRIDKERHDPKGREELRPLVEEMLDDLTPDDAVLALDVLTTHALKYYTRNHPIEYEIINSGWSDSVLVKNISRRAVKHRRIWIPAAHFDRSRIEAILVLLAARWPNMAVMDNRDAIVAFLDDGPRPARLPRDAFELRVPNGDDRAELAVDGDPSTHWMSSSPKTPGWQIALELRAPKRLDAVVLNTPIWPDDWSHELYAHVQTDGSDQWTSAGVSVWEGPRTTIRLGDVAQPIKRVQLTNAQRDKKFHWSIHELEIWAFDD